jgi:trehalose 6-phosphate phosphatase
VLLDVDGTLLDLAPTPHEVHVPPTLLRTLLIMRERSGGAVALVSGRLIGDLDFVFSPLRLTAVGGHGAEIRLDPDGAIVEQTALPLEAGLKQRLKAVASRHRNIIVEDKGHSLALHYRLALDEGLAVVDDVFRACKAFPAESYELLTGKAVIEVKSPGFDKGTAVHTLMKHAPFNGRTPIFIGDDTTDEAAFAAVPDYGGIAISVGRKVAGVDGRFQSPEDVRRWLERLSNNAASSQ